jgi:hypothetical protein
MLKRHGLKDTWVYNAMSLEMHARSATDTPQVGFEPTTRWLTAICSATELLEMTQSLASVAPRLCSCVTMGP